MAKRFLNTTHDAHGRPNTIFLKATAGGPAGRTIVGVAIWAQLSFVAGHGDAPSADLAAAKDVPALKFAGADDARFAAQLWAGLMAARVAMLRAKEAAADERDRAAFVLDLCAVDPVWQRRGAAARLVGWGLAEARRRGGLEATTEASVMGRLVYGKLGFVPVAEIEYGVEEALVKGRTLPSNLFMRTRP